MIYNMWADRTVETWLVELTGQVRNDTWAEITGETWHVNWQDRGDIPHELKNLMDVIYEFRNGNVTNEMREWVRHDKWVEGTVDEWHWKASWWMRNFRGQLMRTTDGSKTDGVNWWTKTKIATKKKKKLSQMTGKREHQTSHTDGVFFQELIITTRI